MLKNTEAPKRLTGIAALEARAAANVIPNPTLAERRAQVMAEYLRTGRI
jgi:hypothetical protein